MMPQLQQSRQHGTSPARRYTATWRQVVLRARTLGIAEDDIRACQTIDAVQMLTKQAYRQLARRYHPDYLAQAPGRETSRRGRYGHSFQTVTTTYRWFQRLEQIRDQRLPRRWRYRGTVPDCEVPWSLLRRPVPLPEGYQEDRSWIVYG